MKHFLAYGNSDQASFRDDAVRDCFDILTVPSTIASYYPDATAAFVLSSGLEYIIEPRTPLFQGVLRDPRASHYTLASVMGASVADQLGQPSSAGSNPTAYFEPDFYSAHVCEELVDAVVDFQRTYGNRAGSVGKQIARYRLLLQKARGQTAQAVSVDEQRGPAFILCPYFACGSRSDVWWRVVERVWDRAQQLPNAAEICPVVAIADVFELEKGIQSIPSGMSDTTFSWVPGFDERKVSVSQLRELRRVVSAVSGERQVVNLYGGFYSILLSKFGLNGFNNGLGYSESRDWPTLDATGAAPARYYVRRLHAYLPTTTATVLVEQDSGLRCKCSVCSDGNRLPNELDYHELKRHFALSRAWEMKLVHKRSVDELRLKLRDDAGRIRSALAPLPSGLNVPVGHMERWAASLAD